MVADAFDVDPGVRIVADRHCLVGNKPDGTVSVHIAVSGHVAVPVVVRRTDGGHRYHVAPDLDAEQLQQNHVG